MENWREVGMDEFYGVIGPMEVFPRIVNDDYPYTTEYLTSRGHVVGKVVGYIPADSALAARRYLLPNARS